MQKATRTKDTETKYIDRAILLCKRALIEAESSGVKTNNHSLKFKYKGEAVTCLSVLATAKWAKSKWFPKYSRSTWRQYRSSLVFLAEYQFNRGVITSSSSIEEISDILSGSNEEAKQLEKKTSAKKMKSISDDDLAKILDVLAHRKSKISGFLSVWLYVNCLVGLRPSEWAKCNIVNKSGSSVLMVRNAKYTNGRSHGEFRAIHLSNFSDNQVNKITEFAQMCNELDKDDMFDSYYESCRKLLQRVCKKIWPKRKKNITLYSTRHQFSADLKKSGKKLEEIAYLMGHYSTDTASSHYGKRRYGKSKVTPEVPRSELNKVASKYKKFTFNRRQGQRL